MRRVGICLGLALAVAWLAAPSGAGAAAKHGTLVLHLPDPGHVTIAAVEVKARGVRAPKRAPRNLKLRLLDTRRLPPSIRILTARRRITARKTLRYELLVIAINKAGVASAADDDKFNLQDLFMAYVGGGVRSHKCATCGNQIPAGDNFCPACQFHSAEAKNVDEFGGKVPVLSKTLMDAFGVEGSTDPVFGDGSGTPPEPSLDTGHYDDGHAFGWNVKTKTQEIDLEHQAVEDLLQGQPQAIVPQFEIVSGVDLNADGKIGSSSGQQINTVVGPPTIT